MIVQKMIIQIFMQRQDHREEIDKEALAPHACEDTLELPSSSAPAVVETKLENMDGYLWQRLLERFGTRLLDPIPGPCWTFQLGPIPPQPIVRPKWKAFDPAWLLPLHWYWSQLPFPGPPKDMELMTKRQHIPEGISWMELVFDCELATHTQFLHHARSKKKETGPTSGRDRARYFAAATRQLFKMCGGPRLPTIKVSSLQTFGGREVTGLPVRPKMCQPRHLFAELAHQSMMHRRELFGRGDSSHWSWPPYYKRPPKPSWSSSAVPPSTTPRFRIRSKQTVNNANSSDNGNIMHDSGRVFLAVVAACGVQPRRRIFGKTDVGSAPVGGQVGCTVQVAPLHGAYDRLFYLLADFAPPVVDFEGSRKWVDF